MDQNRNFNKKLVQLLQEDRVLITPVVIGELLLGNLTNRKEIKYMLERLPKAEEVTNEEVIMFIVQAIVSEAELFTLDKKLANIYHKLT